MAASTNFAVEIRVGHGGPSSKDTAFYPNPARNARQFLSVASLPQLRGTLPPISLAISEVNMINNKQYCIENLSSSLRRSASWRRSLQIRYPDPRNARAAEKLEQLATEACDLSEEAWLELQKFYNWSSFHWSESVSAVSRQVGFRNVNTLPAFVSALLGILSEQH
jgi:hypothetical protein